MKSLGSAAAKVAGPVLGRRGFGEAQMILQWASVVGEGLASETQPVKLSFGRGERVDGTLHLRVTSGVAPTIRHLEPLMVERVNAYFGYRAVGRLALRQGPIDRPPERKPPPDLPLLSPEEADNLDQQLAGIAEPALRNALQRLGRRVLAERAGLRAP